MKSVLVALLACAVINAVLGFSPSDYDHAKNVHSDITFHWSIVGSGDSQEIRFAIEANTTGWIGFGIGEPTSGSMPGADIMIAKVVSSALVVEDRYSYDFVEPELDDPCDNNWVAGSYTRASGRTTVEVSRELAAKDNFHDRPIVNNGQPTKLIFAFGSTNTFSQHSSTNRVMISINLFNPNDDPLEDVANAAGTLSFTIKQNDYTIPEDVTTYTENLCENIVQDRWMIATKMRIQESTRKYIHHMVLWGHFASNCGSGKVALFSTASHDTPFIFPDNVGLLLSDYDSVMLEIHYNNPDQDVGVKDNSGLEIYYSLTARTHAAGVLQLGDPRIKLFGDTLQDGISSYTFTCPSASTSKWNSDITVFATFLHMHSTGIKMSTTQSGSASRVTNSIEYYDFHMQESTPVTPFVIKKGDTLVTTCFYESDGTVVFGTGSDDEMCIDFVYYYPVQNMMEGYYCGNEVGGGTFEGQSRVYSDVSEIGRVFGDITAEGCGSSASLVKGLSLSALVLLLASLFLLL